jgi:3-oxoadipate enol-lactonase
MKSYSVNSVELAVMERGCGTPLLLVHGFPLTHEMWHEQIAALSRQYRVIAPDLRGFGRSGVTPGVVTMEQFADDLAALLDAMDAGQPVVYCGLSMGGYIAWQFWRKYFSRLRAMVLCDTRAAADSPEAAANRVTTANRVLGEGPQVVVESMTPKLLATSTRARRPDVVLALQRMMMANDRQGIAAASRGMGQRPDMTPCLGEIRCPVLVLAGQWDAVSPPAEMRGIAEAIPGARFVEIPGAGHMSPMEQPVEVNAAMFEFLAEIE